MSGKSKQNGRSSRLRRGDVVTVRTADEILATLEADAKLGGLVFMPEMIPFCGKSFRIARRAEKTCVEGTGLRSLQNAVFLDSLRCDGSAHGGCQRGCLFFWHEAWLKQEEGLGIRDWELDSTGCSNHQSLIPNPSLLPTTRDDHFYCQSTELLAATGEFPFGRLRSDLHDLRIGEVSPRRILFVLGLALWDRIWLLLRGRKYHQLSGEQKRTLTAELNLQPGEWVEIKSRPEIEATLDEQGRNRGLWFEPEMALHCGRRYRVAGPIKSIIAEQTGKMVQLRNTVILEGLVCQGICALNCPRANYLYWREIWLKRVEEQGVRGQRSGVREQPSPHG